MKLRIRCCRVNGDDIKDGIVKERDVICERMWFVKEGELSKIIRDLEMRRREVTQNDSLI